MQLPLVHRTTQMALLKKLIRRKARELRRRKHRAHRRLEMMRRIRKELLRKMQRSIDLRQRDADEERREQARRAVGSMLNLYKGWLQNWSRALSTQGRLLRQQEQLKRRLDGRLKLLRKQLRKRRRPQRLVDKCFQKLSKAVRKWQQSPDYHPYIEGQERIWEQEAEEVRRYLSDFRGKSSKHRKSRRRRVSLDGDLHNFTSFWKNEVLRKKKELRKSHSTSEGTKSEWEVYTIPKPTRMPLIISNRVRPKGRGLYLNIEDLSGHQRHKKRRKSITRKEKDPLGPSLKELKQLLAELLTYNPTEQKIRRAARKPRRKQAKKPPKVDLYQELEKAINNTKPQSIYLFKKHRKSNINQKKLANFNLNRLLDIGSAMKAKILESRVVSIKKPRSYKKYGGKVPPLQFHWPINFRKHIPTKLGLKAKSRYSKKPKKPKYKFVDEVIKEELTALTKYSLKQPRHKRLRKQKDLDVTSELSVPGIRLHRLKKKRKRKAGKAHHRSSTQLSDTGTLEMVGKLRKRRNLYEASLSELIFGRDSVISLSESLNKIIMDSRPRKSLRKSFRGGLGLGLGLPVAQRKSSTQKTGPPLVSMYPYLSQKNKLLRASMSDDLNPRRSRRFSTRMSVSEPMVARPRKSLKASDLRRLRRQAQGSEPSSPDRLSNQSRDRTSHRSQDRTSYRSQDRSSRRSSDRLSNRSRDRLSNRSEDRVRDPFAVDDFSSEADLFSSDQVPPYIRGDKKRRKASEKIIDQMSNRVGDNMGNRFGYTFGNEAGDRLSKQAGDIIGYRMGDGDKTRRQYGDNISNRIGDGIRNQFGEEIYNRVGDKYSNRGGDKTGNQDMFQNLQAPGSMMGDQGPSRASGREHQKFLDYEPLPDYDKFLESRTDSRYDLDSLRLSAESRKEQPGQVAQPDGQEVPNLKQIGSPKRSRFLLKDLVSDPKFNTIQYFLKDTIENNQILDQVVDPRGLMQAVGKHFRMWSNLNDLYTEMLAGGIAKEDVRRLLSAKYLEYLRTIQTEKNFALIVTPLLVTSLQGIKPDPDQAAIKQKQAKVDQLFGKHFWKRHRMSTRIIPFGIKGLPKDKISQQSERHSINAQTMDSALYKKLIQQELNVERLKLVERKRRLSLNRMSTSLSSTSTNTTFDVAPNEEQALRDAEERYSIKNIKSMMNEHKVRFLTSERSRMMEEVRQKKLDVEAKMKEMRSVSLFKQTPPTESPKGTSRQVSRKRGKRHLRPINQLYYAPRQTARQRKIILSLTEEEQEEAVKKSEEEFHEKCPRCGVNVALPTPSPPSSNASSGILSSGSIEACAKSELLINTISNLCTRCGYVHDEAEPCSQVAQDRRSTTILRMIKAVQAVRSAQATQCPAYCSPQKIRREKDLRSCGRNHHQVPFRLLGVESRVRRCGVAGMGYESTKSAG